MINFWLFFSLLAVIFLISDTTTVAEQVSESFYYNTSQRTSELDIITNSTIYHELNVLSISKNLTKTCSMLTLAVKTTGM